ncbi:hypothetical protein C8J56DRAFT_348606 [Mycena floridula]|nr:hypothetical protein C8J56DRAFT_348606 [Mycena floridula]
MLRLLLPDGASLAYDILGTEHIDEKQPIVLVGGLSSIRGDWERLAASLGKTRPVLIFDHRGIGDSTFSSPQKDDEITIESMARDMLQLLQSLRWPSISICGFFNGRCHFTTVVIPPERHEPNASWISSDTCSANRHNVRDLAGQAIWGSHQQKASTRTSLRKPETRHSHACSPGSFRSTMVGR